MALTISSSFKRVLLLTLTIFSLSATLNAKDIVLKLPPAVMKGVNANISIEGIDQITNTPPKLLINGVRVSLEKDKDGYHTQHSFTKPSEIQVISTGKVITKNVNPIPLWLSILPPLIAIIMALITKEVFSSLFVGLLFGTATIYKYAGVNFFIAIGKGTLAIVDTYLMESLVDADHISIIIFSMLIGGMVTIISMNGGMKGIVNVLSKYARNRRSGQFITYLMGLVIFFDDYANTLVVGNTMRPVTDKLKISREKLAYLVDSTSAPIAAIAFITTWIGAELSYIQEGIINLGLNTTPYSVFINSLQYSFYPVLTLVFAGLIIWQQRDFGPMLTAEKQVTQNDLQVDKKEGKRSPQIMKELEVAENITPRWFNAVIPILVVVIGTLIGLIYTGWDATTWMSKNLSFTAKLSHTIGDADVFSALVWSSLTGVFTAIILSSVQRLLSMKESIEAVINGFKTMFHALLILSLAWSLALLTSHLHTADFITQILTSINISPLFIPALTFVFSAFIAFSTGSSWGTMAIIYPLMLPAVWKLGVDAGMPHDEVMPLFYNVVSAVLAGSVLGDHCSPISDTTILSSLACSCNHIHHVRTQMPYALTVAGIAVIFGTLPVAFGLPVWISYIISIATIFAIVKLIGKKV
ncbi:Na+/H+ antiporter NhaC family protein [Carboxylicivirga caseinilyticus]|uniref:Na+/H+ antiporter NhaC family protein n=1 Tax=Carboxylicivirga caseinilyticus TaxID=3417572 RepID=UPI003D32CD20|nr:hypothetical protein [Marinilabiliaceae bacterium A049]